MYELACLINPLLEKNDVEAVLEKIRRFIIDQDGTIKKDEIWEKRKLAYPVRKHLLGYYAIIDFELANEKIEDLPKELKFNNDILRFLLIGAKEEALAPVRRKPIRPKAAIPKPVVEAVIPKEKIKIEELDKKLEEILKE